MHRCANLLAAAIAGLFFCRAAETRGDDWPTCRHDNRRSGVCSDPIRPPLRQSWVFKPPAAPARAWGERHGVTRRDCDDTLHVAVAGDVLYFGSSADYKIYALDAAGGEIRWEVYTEGPVRIAPTVHNGLVYAGSDDGNVYCVDADRGREVWTFAAAPSPRRVAGHGKLISLWPVRTGVTVDNGTAYFGAGIFPSEGVYLYAVDATDSRLLWKNNDYGRGGLGTVSPRGCILVSQERIFLPSALSGPAAFDRKNGRFLFQAGFDAWTEGVFAGDCIVLGKDVFFGARDRLVCARQADGALLRTEGPTAGLARGNLLRLAVDGDTMYYLNGKQLVAAKVSEWQSGSSLAALWRTPCTGDAIAVTRDFVFAGGDGRLQAFDRSTGEEKWSTEIEGRALGLAAARRRLFVSTGDGAIHCYIEGREGTQREVKPSVAVNPFQRDGLTAAYPRAAEDLLRDTGVTRGFALIVGGDGRLALELVKQTGLTIYVLHPDEDIVSRARDGLTQAGVYGTRAAVFRRGLERLPCADYFADLVVCRTDPDEGVPTPAAEVLRVLKPRGGTACVGAVPAAPGAGNWKESASLKKWLDDLSDAVSDVNEPDTRISLDGNLAKVVRGPLPGAGAWTHRYAEAGNTACSGDRRISGALSVLWFGSADIDRSQGGHSQAVTPLILDGRIFVRNENIVKACDAYNGLKIWQRKIADAADPAGLTGVHGKLAADTDGIYAAAADRCVRLDKSGGDTIAVYSIPEGLPDGTWNYLACFDGLLYGSVKAGDRRGDSALFAIHTRNGKTAWVHEAKGIAPSTVCIADRRLFYLGGSVTAAQREEALSEWAAAEKDSGAAGGSSPPDVRLVVCLDARKGKVRWTRPVCPAGGITAGAAGGDPAAMAADRVLLLHEQPANDTSRNGISAADSPAGGLLALHTRNGRILWSRPDGYRSRPVIVGQMVVAEPWAYDLQTGAELLRTNAVTGVDAKWRMARPGGHAGGCLAAAAHMLFGRAGPAAWYDLDTDSGTVPFGLQREDCRTDCVPAEGVVAMFHAGSGCTGPRGIAGVTVLHPRPDKNVWGVYSSPGGNRPVKRLAVNLGAPGDRRDSAGKLWLAYPRPFSGELVMDVPVEAEPSEDTVFFCGDPDFTGIDGTVDPWLYVSGWSGATDFNVRLHDDRFSYGQYAIRLHFAENSAIRAGERVFHVEVAGEKLLENFDIFNEAGAAHKALTREFRGVRAMGSMHFVLTALRGRPLLAGVEIEREFVPPTVTNATVEIVENKPALISLPVTFPDGQPMYVETSIVEGPEPGMLEHKVGRHYLYTPAVHYIGPDGFTWRATDGVTVSRAARTVISVVRDAAAPVIKSVTGTGLPDEILVVFDEPVAARTAARPAAYKVDPGIVVRAARLLRDGRSVLLETDRLTERGAYSVSASGIKDRARKPNAGAATASYTHTLTGYILYEVWTGIEGAEVADLTGCATFPKKPTTARRIDAFSAPANWADNYGSRISGYVRPPETGDYTFWIASDDKSELWLSPGRLSAEKALIASVPERTDDGQWDLYPEQKSEPILLESGKDYYIEALHKEAGGGDSLSVAWQGPGIERQVIPGNCLLLPEKAQEDLR